MERRTLDDGRSPDASAPAPAGKPSASRPIEVVDVAEIPGGGQLHLLKCGEEFSIQFGEDELMGSRDHLSEQALATLTCERLASNDGHVLVGGLGMGFTLGAVLKAWAPGSSVVVAELVPQIVSWAKGHLAHLFGANLSDPRVSIQLEDVHDVIIKEQDRFDAILLDVDNGPDGFMTPANDRLYCRWGLRATYAALRPSGVLPSGPPIPIPISPSGWNPSALRWRKPSCPPLPAARTNGIISGSRRSRAREPSPSERALFCGCH